MARMPKDDPRFNDNTWNYHAETDESCTPGGINALKQTPLACNPNVIPDNVYGRQNFANDMFAKPMQTVDNTVTRDDKNSFNPNPNPNRVNRQNYGNAMLNLGNGQMVRVFYDENNQQLIFPMSGQYELFNNNQGMCDVPIQAVPSHLFTLNQEFTINNNAHVQSSATIHHSNFNQENVNQSSNIPTSNFLKEVLGNWEPNLSGTYSPFGQNYPLNHPDAPTISNNMTESNFPQMKCENSPKRNENGPLADTNNKKRIVAEVKPMRPSYSDVLAKNTKNTPLDVSKKVKPPNTVENKTPNKLTPKSENPPNLKQINDENKKCERKLHTTLSSGSESGDFNTDDTEKLQKTSKKSKNKRNNMSRKWSSLDDITNEEGLGQDNESQFIFIKTDTEKLMKKGKKPDKPKNIEINDEEEEDFNFDDDEAKSQFVLQEGQIDAAKSRKRKDSRNHHKSSKVVQDKKKANQTKVRRNKPGYMGLVQNYVEHWGGATWKAVIWFIYLLSDICRMSLHLSFDLCTSLFTQTYVSSQAIWRSSKDWFSKMGSNKLFVYIDKKFGATRFAFWRKMKWFKKETETDSSNNDSTKLNTNIPLPSTGEEAMKRLLACKGKDPYSILGVSVTCTDEDIKRYYRRQAFLVHPDKNQQPGAEEAFKILQHAFDLIGEPERREAYEQRARESRNAEAAWGELSVLLAQLHDKMEFAANTIRCTNCGRRHKRVLSARPCYAARYCSQCKIRHSAKEGDIWAESSMMGLLVMYYACMDGAVYQITQWASCQKKNLKQLRPDCHVVQYRIVLGNKAAAADFHPHHRPSTGPDPNLEEFLNKLYSKTGVSPNTASPKQPPTETVDQKKRRNKKPKA